MTNLQYFQKLSARITEEKVKMVQDGTCKLTIVAGDSKWTFYNNGGRISDKPFAYYHNKKGNTERTVTIEIAA